MNTSLTLSSDLGSHMIGPERKWRLHRFMRSGKPTARLIAPTGVQYSLHSDALPPAVASEAHTLIAELEGSTRPL